MLTPQQIERHLIAVDEQEQYTPQGTYPPRAVHAHPAVISEVIRDQNAAFMALAEQVATLHAEIDSLKKDYVKWYQARFHSVRDPFAQGAAAADHS